MVVCSSSVIFNSTKDPAQDQSGYGKYLHGMGYIIQQIIYAVYPQGIACFPSLDMLQRVNNLVNSIFDRRKWVEI